jgi:hypothetical protein
MGSMKFDSSQEHRLAKRLDHMDTLNLSSWETELLKAWKLSPLVIRLTPEQVQAALDDSLELLVSLHLNQAVYCQTPGAIVTLNQTGISELLGFWVRSKGDLLEVIVEENLFYDSVLIGLRYHTLEAHPLEGLVQVLQEELNTRLIGGSK